MSTTRVTFVCQWYPPEPVEIPAGIVDALRSEGLDLQVLTGIPNYPDGVVAEGYRPASVVRDAHEGVPILRTPLYPSHDTRAARRMLNYASWAIGAALFGQLRLKRSDVALVYSSPATAALPAMVAKALWRTRYVLLVQDVWPDSIFASGFLTGRVSRLVRGVVDIFVRRAYAMADHVVVISPGMADLLASRGVAAEKLTVVYNWLPDEAADAPAPNRRRLRELAGLPDDATVFLYAGNHGRAQALDAVVDAFGDPATEPAHLVMLGAGVSKDGLVQRAAASPRVHFLPPVARETAGELIASADVSVVSLADEPLFAVTMPSKVQAGLAAGRPMLVVARGDSADIVERSEAGVSARPGDAADIATAVTTLSMRSREALVDMGHRGAALYADTMAKRVGAARMAAILNSVAQRSRSERQHHSNNGSRPE